MNELTISLLELFATVVLTPAIGYIIYVLKDNRERNKKSAELAEERDKKIQEVLELSKEQAIALAKQDEVLKNQDKVLREQSDSLHKQDEILDLHTAQLNAVGEAAGEELGKTLEEMAALYQVQGFVTSPQLREFEKRYLIYHDGLHRNGIIQKKHEMVMKLPVRDDLEAINLTNEIVRQAVDRSRRSNKPQQQRKPRPKKGGEQ